MALIDQSMNNVLLQDVVSEKLPAQVANSIKSAIRKEFADDVWREYRKHQDDVIVSIIVKKWRVRDIPFIKDLIVKLVGNEPQSL